MLAAAALVACRSPEPPAPPLQPRPVVEIARWQALDAGRPVGTLVELEIRDPAGPIRFYQVTDAAGRVVGSATAEGRFGRRVPFREQEEDLGVWSLARGVAELFELTRPVELAPVAVDADMRRR